MHGDTKGIRSQGQEPQGTAPDLPTAWGLGMAPGPRPGVPTAGPSRQDKGPRTPHPRTPQPRSGTGDPEHLVLSSLSRVCSPGLSLERAWGPCRDASGGGGGPRPGAEAEGAALHPPSPCPTQPTSWPCPHGGSGIKDRSRVASVPVDRRSWRLPPAGQVPHSPLCPHSLGPTCRMASPEPSAWIRDSGPSQLSIPDAWGLGQGHPHGVPRDVATVPSQVAPREDGVPPPRVLEDGADAGPRERLASLSSETQSSA